MRITESKLRSIIRQVIKESFDTRDTDPRDIYPDPAAGHFATSDDAALGYDAEGTGRTDSKGNRFSLDELGYTVEDGIIYDERGQRVGELDSF